MFSVYIATGHVEGSTQLKPFLLLFFVCSHRDGMRLIEKNVYLYLKRQWAWLRPISILVTKSNNIPKMWAERQILDSGSCENLSGFPRKKNFKHFFWAAFVSIANFRQSSSFLFRTMIKPHFLFTFQCQCHKIT